MAIFDMALSLASRQGAKPVWVSRRDLEMYTTATIVADAV